MSVGGQLSEEMQTIHLEDRAVPCLTAAADERWDL
jgi:hypothetical protein